MHKKATQVYGYWRVRARGAGSARGSHRLGEPAHLRLDGVSEHAGDVVPPRVSVDRAAGFIVPFCSDQAGTRSPLFRTLIQPDPNLSLLLQGRSHEGCEAFFG